MPRAAAYTGTTHPTAVYLDTGTQYLPRPDADIPAREGLLAHPNPAEVQVVACVRLIREELDEPLAQCTYGTLQVMDKLYQGVYRLDVYEARTGRHIGSSQLKGQEDEGCPDSRVFSRGNLTDLDIYTEPDTSTLRGALALLVR